jgi:hypothetical protein
MRRMAVCVLVFSSCLPQSGAKGSDGGADGGVCSSDAQCPSGSVCSNSGSCLELNTDGGIACSSNAGCPQGAICAIGGVCETPQADAGSCICPPAMVCVSDGGCVETTTRGQEGSPCQMDSDCDGGTMCLLPRSVSHPPLGVCVDTCAPGSTCADGSMCVGCGICERDFTFCGANSADNAVCPFTGSGGLYCVSTKPWQNGCGIFVCAPQ